MNERDSEIMAQLLEESSYLKITDINLADLIIVNTCNIRGKAAQKAYSLLGCYKKLKEKKPKLIIAVTGCVAQQEGTALTSRMPYIDLVLGPQNIYKLAAMVKALCKNRKSYTAITLSPDFVIPPFLPNFANNNTHKRFVTIMQGCNNFCTYCVVPYTRGREISRKFTDILDEVSHLSQKGVREITLLGQNVNSYGQNHNQKQTNSFPKLLKKVATINGIKRVRFTTSHPKDISDALIHCFTEHDNICRHFHLPVQSGSNHILKRMNRKYSIENYLATLNNLKQYCPDIAVTTDIIVGFPGETDKDFKATINLLETVRFHSVFSFKYSDRPDACAANFTDKVDESIKSQRLATLQQRQNEISFSRNREYIGKQMAIMIEGKSKNGGNQWSGRTDSNHIVNFDYHKPLLPGQLCDVIITKACQNSLKGELINHD